jgi:hypothetical protein
MAALVPPHHSNRNVPPNCAIGRFIAARIAPLHVSRRSNSRARGPGQRVPAHVSTALPLIAVEQSQPKCWRTPRIETSAEHLLTAQPRSRTPTHLQARHKPIPIGPATRLGSSSCVGNAPTLRPGLLLIHTTPPRSRHNPRDIRGTGLKWTVKWVAGALGRGDLVEPRPPGAARPEIRPSQCRFS